MSSECSTERNVTWYSLDEYKDWEKGEILWYATSEIGPVKGWWDRPWDKFRDQNGVVLEFLPTHWGREKIPLGPPKADPVCDLSKFRENTIIDLRDKNAELSRALAIAEELAETRRVQAINADHQLAVSLDDAYRKGEMLSTVTNQNLDFRTADLEKEAQIESLEEDAKNQRGRNEVLTAWIRRLQDQLLNKGGKMSPIDTSWDGENWTADAGILKWDNHITRISLQCALCQQVLPATLVSMQTCKNDKAIELVVTPPKGWFVHEGQIVCSDLCSIKLQIELLRAKRETMTLRIQHLQKVAIAKEEIPDA